MQEAPTVSPPTSWPLSNPSSSTMASAAATSHRASSASRPPPPAASNGANLNNAGQEAKKDALCGRVGKPGKPFGAPRGLGGKPRRSLDAFAAGGSDTSKRSHKATFKGSGRPQTRQVDDRRQWSSSASMTEADEFEVGSVFNAGSKKQSLNHLLNFQFEPRGAELSNRYGQRHKGPSRFVARSKYNKEQYLQANCQFVVKSSSDLSIYLEDPDILVAWELIEQVGLKTSGVPSCPICLYPPTAAKIARCGHVFCWSCILHYLALSDDAWRKCPICYDSIYREDLKSVVSLLHSDLNTGQEIEMQLMRRERNSLFAVPVGKYFHEINRKHPSILQRLNSYSKLVTATPAEVAHFIIAREKIELEAQYRANKDEPESCFIDEALKYLTEREIDILSSTTLNDSAAMLDTVSEILEEQKQNTLPEATSDEAFVECNEQRPRHISSGSEGASSIDDDPLENDLPVSAKDLDISSLMPEEEDEGLRCSGVQARKDTFYFYQSADGQAIFLHALNVQMLVHEYGSFDNCPAVIRGAIVEKDGSVMTEELRNKLRYLRHLPVTCNFEVCEIQLSRSLVSKETFAAFQEQLESRRRRRAKRAREEKRREKRILLEENKLMGIFPGAKLRIESNFHFPEVGSSLRRSSESLFGSPPTGGEEAAGFDNAMVEETTPSFARMLRDGTAKASAAKVLLQPVQTSHPRRNSDSEPEGYLPPPRQTSIGDALALALEKAAIIQGAEGNKKKGKKNKGTKILLTSATRREI